jgi:hypothetical protein
LFRKDQCLTSQAGKTNILILGDSHAADLWYGLQKLYPDVNVMQATGATCRPMIDIPERPHCTALMNFIFKEFLPSVHLDVIVLAARWHASRLDGLNATASALRAYADKVFVLGPIVEYDQPLPRLLARSIVANNPALVAKHRLREQVDIDEHIAKALAGDVKYVSLYQTICHPECAVLTDDEPLQWDYGHLTKAGSTYVATRIGPLLLQGASKD